MRAFFILLSREIKSFFYSPVAYVVLFCILLLDGLSFYWSAWIMNHKFSQLTLAENYFNSITFIIGIIFSSALITMRLFAEEYKMGTIESLMTAPVRDWQVVLSKYFGAIFFFIVLLLPTAIYFPVFEWIAKTNATMSPGAYAGGYIIVLMLGMFYIAIGCLASALTRNQIAAAVMALVAIFMHYLSGLLISFGSSDYAPIFRDFASYFSAPEHLVNFSTGNYDTRPVVLYFTMTFLVLVLTYHVFQSRKWKS